MKDKKQLNFPIPGEMWQGLLEKAQAKTRMVGKQVSMSFLVRRAIEDSLTLERVLCPECENIFLAPENWTCCPVCGLRVGEEPLDEFLVE